MMTTDDQDTFSKDLEVDDDLSSVSGDSFQSDTTSLTSTAYEHVYENGRRYHNYRAGKYVMPNDEQEQDRLDMFHHVWLSLMNGETHKVPLKNPKKVLDLGAGTGIWAIEFGDQFPDCSVEGVDLSPIQPGWVPPNVKFVMDDIEDPWVYEKNSFDYIHSRMMIGSIQKWKEYLQNIYDHLKPGGYVELQEADGEGYYSEDGTFAKDGGFAIFLDMLVKASAASGRPYVVAKTFEGLMKEVGFVDVEHSRYKLPLGTWPKNKKMKQLGAYGLALASAATEAYGLALCTRVMGLTEQKSKEFMKAAVDQISDKKTHAIFALDLFTARKPEAKC